MVSQTNSGPLQAAGLSAATLHADQGGAAHHAQVRRTLIAALADAMAVRKLSQVQAARLCGTDQPTISKVLRGRTSSVTIDKLLDWLVALGCSVELTIGSAGRSGPGAFTATHAGDLASMSTEGR